MESLEIDKKLLRKEISDILSKYIFEKNIKDIRNQITDDLEKLLQKYQEKYG